MAVQKIGTISAHVAALLGLSNAVNMPILIGASNIEHMKTSHPADYEKYGDQISLIVNDPDYVGINQSDGSIEYVKEYKIDDEYVKVAVRISTKGQYYARSLYVLNNNRVHNFIKKGTLKLVDKT